MADQTVAMEADAAVNGARQQNYGPPDQNFQRIANMWNAYLQSKYPGLGWDAGYLCQRLELGTRDVSAMMRLLKEARLMNGYHRDSLVDIVGYALCDEKIEAARG